MGYTTTTDSPRRQDRSHCFDRTMWARSYLVMLTIPDSGIYGARRVPLGRCFTPREKSEGRSIPPSATNSPKEPARMSIRGARGVKRRSFRRVTLKNLYVHEEMQGYIGA